MFKKTLSDLVSEVYAWILHPLCVLCSWGKFSWKMLPRGWLAQYFRQSGMLEMFWSMGGSYRYCPV